MPLIENLCDVNVECAAGDARRYAAITQVRSLLRTTATITAQVATVFLAAGTCFACDCITLSPSESLKAADLVFIGRVVQSDKSDGQVNSTFQVEQVLKGSGDSEVVIAGQMSDCDFSFQSGRTYIVYARSSGGHFFASTCMTTKTLGVSVERKPALIHYTSPPRYGYRAIVAGVVILLALSLGYLAGRFWTRAA